MIVVILCKESLLGSVNNRTEIKMNLTKENLIEYIEKVAAQLGEDEDIQKLIQEAKEKIKKEKEKVKNLLQIKNNIEVNNNNDVNDQVGQVDQNGQNGQIGQWKTII